MNISTNALVEKNVRLHEIGNILDIIENTEYVVDEERVLTDYKREGAAEMREQILTVIKEYALHYACNYSEDETKYEKPITKEDLPW